MSGGKMTSQGEWLTITEYSFLKNKSISTIRRYIKANRVKTKLIDGKYYIWTNKTINLNENISSNKVIKKLEEKIKHLTEENNELKMLIELYENNHFLKAKQEESVLKQ